MRPRRCATPVALVGVLLLSSCTLQGTLKAPDQGQAQAGQPARNFSGTDLDGRPISLSQFLGHPILLNFWASWCGPCRAEQPGLVHLAQTYSGRGLKVVGIDIRDNLDQAKIYRDEFKMPYPSLFDQAGELAYAYQIDAPPSSVLIDTKGRVVEKIAGGLGEDLYKQIIDSKFFPKH